MPKTARVEGNEKDVTTNSKKAKPVNSTLPTLTWSLQQTQRAYKDGKVYDYQLRCTARNKDTYKTMSMRAIDQLTQSQSTPSTPEKGSYTSGAASSWLIKSAPVGFCNMPSIVVKSNHLFQVFEGNVHKAMVELNKLTKGIVTHILETGTDDSFFEIDISVASADAGAKEDGNLLGWHEVAGDEALSSDVEDYLSVKLTGHSLNSIITTMTKSGDLMSDDLADFCFVRRNNSTFNGIIEKSDLRENLNKLVKQLKDNMKQPLLFRFVFDEGSIRAFAN